MSKTTLKTASPTPRPKQESLWTRFEDNQSPTITRPRARKFRWIVDAVLPLALTTVAAIAVLLPGSLPNSARLALFAFALAVILWSTTSINAAYVALAAMMLLILSGGSTQEQLYQALASDVIWLMIGAFILGGAVQQTGLASRLTGLVVARAYCWQRVLAADNNANSPFLLYPLNLWSSRRCHSRLSQHCPSCRRQADYARTSIADAHSNFSRNDRNFNRCRLSLNC